ncbi:cupin domain-containing protein [Solirubrobacter phytolaccae]|uniref:Cupin domain-containing protein n=1 Tax=Solirubrobacter phytolaccae TaxID=1404360 RepID=A0A9X3SA56_9ACTN|nr:cupin domain-containing protein [Solirubrobacter phytolaccae]MDA0183288.1 cupin domain-containing protein [Solirubrobacter phytolaccae]
MHEVTPGEGEIIGDSPERTVELLAELDAVHATLSRFGPGRDGADLHIHRAHADVFVVLEGDLTLKVEGGERVVGAGTVVAVPPMVAHGFRNGSAADVWYVNLHMPGTGFGDYMRGLRDKVKVAFDQFEPPADGVGLKPADAIVTAPSPVEIDGVVVVLDDDGTVTVGDQLRINPKK